MLLMRKRALIAFILLPAFYMSYECYCFVALIQGAVGWSAVCGCGISLEYSLAFSYIL